MATLITVVILQIPELQLVEVAGVLDWIFMTLPNYSLGMAFNNLYTNSRAVEYCTRPIVVFACKTGLRPNPCCKSITLFYFSCFETNLNIRLTQQILETVARRLAYNIMRIR